MDVHHPVNRIPPGRASIAANVRAYIGGGFKLRNLLTSAIVTVSAAIQTIDRLNDTTTAGPASGFSYIANGGSTLYSIQGSVATTVATGLSGNPISLIPFRPNASVQPWMYTGDTAQDDVVTIYTKFAINNAATTFQTNGMLKVRSDGLTYKAGIMEPQVAPTVSTQTTTATTTGELLATAIPWTNYNGVNSNYNYGETNGYPSPTPDGTAPFLVDVANATYVLITALTGTATINGGSKTPSSLGPSPSSATNPGHFVMAQGTGTTPPATASVVIGAFTDGSGNVVTAGSAPLYIPAVVDVGFATPTTKLQVPSGAQAFQIGINSTGNTFSSNSGDFSITVEVVTEALPTVTSILGTLSLSYFGDSPTSGPVGSYIWKNPDDPSGGGPSRSVSNANGTTTGNSFIFDATFTAGLPSLPGVGTSASPMEWTTLNSDSVAVGETPVFAAPLITTYPTQTTYANFNFCLTGNLYFPAAGDYTLVLTNHDDAIFGIGGGVTLVSATSTFNGSATTPAISGAGQTITVVNGYPLLPRSPYTSGSAGTYAVSTVVINVPAAGIYPIEIDYDYWYNSGRILLLDISPTPGASPYLVPPLPANVRTNVSYAGVYRSSLTGAYSNPGPTSTPQTIPVTANTISLPYSPDPQVDKVDYYRQDEGLANYTYTCTGPNTNPPTPVTDSQTDLALASNQILQYDNYEPVPSIDLPQSGTVNVSGGVITWVSGDQFNIRWLAGTLISIGYPTQISYSFISRPTSTTTITLPNVPDGSNLTYNIAEPILANQPLAYLFGPTDNINFTFGVGDPLRPGTLYWCLGSNLDSWAQTNQMDVTDPSEALVNGVMSSGRGVVFSIRRAWIIMPNFFNALATVTGVSGSTWTLQDTSISRGLFIPRCLAIEGGGIIAFRVDDGIHISQGGLASQSITDDDLYPLFVHEGSIPQPVTRNGITIYPPNDALPNDQKFSIIHGYLYYDYVGTDGNQHTLVFDFAAMGWIWDVNLPAVTARTANEGLSTQGTLVGCTDGSVRMLSSSGVETPIGTVVTPAIGGQGWQTMYQVTVEYSAATTIGLSFIPADVNNGSYGPPAVTLPSTGGAPTKYTFKVGPSKWKWMQFQFQSSDPLFEVFLQGFAIEIKNWGSTAAYRPVNPFSAAGGFGPEV
jgi:hypothetical protein